MSLLHNDIFAVFGARGMAGSAISRALTRHGYRDQLLPNRCELDLLDRSWSFTGCGSIVRCGGLAAAKVGGIQANNHYLLIFLREY